MLFINRIDEVVVFHPLNHEQIREIAQLQLKYLRERLMQRDMKIDISSKALDLLAESGFDPVFGARPLNRAIQQQLETPLAHEIVAGHFGPGDFIFVDAHDEKIVFLHNGNIPCRQSSGR